MKILKFILMIGLIVTITSIIPMFLFKQAMDLSPFSKPVEGSYFGGVVGYLTKITSDSNATLEIKENAAKMSSVYHDVLKYKNEKFGIYSGYLVVILGIILIIFGITLSRLTGKKFICSCLITAGFITLCFCAYTFITITQIFTIK